MTKPSQPSVRTQLVRAARDLQMSSQQCFLLYGFEGFLSRLAVSTCSRDFVLKGGALLAAFDLRRPTSDIDLSVATFTNDKEQLLTRIKAILEIDLDDGLTFDLTTLRFSTIREGHHYAGICCKFDAFVERSKVAMSIDVNFGDPIHPGPIPTEVHSILPSQAREANVLAYSKEMIFAEKYLTTLAFGAKNTRLRDIADMHALLGVIDRQAITEVTRVVARHRAITIAPLSPLLDGWASKQQIAWLRIAAKNHVNLQHKSFEELFEEVAIQVQDIFHTEFK